jgi:hypothetical protein
MGLVQKPFGGITRHYNKRLARDWSVSNELLNEIKT